MQPNFKNKCIICGASEKLNTTMTVQVETSYEVVLCDGCAEETTPKMVKEAVKEKISEYSQLLEKMKEFGINVTGETSGGIVLAEAPAAATEGVEVEPQQKPRPVVALPKQQKMSAPRIAQPKITVDSSLAGEQVVMNGAFNTKSMIQGAIQSGKEKGRIDKDFTSEIPVTESVEPQVIDTPEGVPMALPKRIHGSDGSVTDITIVSTSDADIQRRAKELERSRENPNVHTFAGGYNLTECPLCHTKGRLKIGNQVCPKCKGKGYL